MELMASAERTVNVGFRPRLVLVIGTLRDSQCSGTPDYDVVLSGFACGSTTGGTKQH